MALSKEKKKGCFYTVSGPCQKTFVTGCSIEVIRPELVFLAFSPNQTLRLQKLISNNSPYLEGSNRVGQFEIGYLSPEKTGSENCV